MKKQDNGASSKTTEEYASIINALLKLSFNNFDLTTLPDILSKELGIAKSVDPDFAAFVVALARSWNSLNKSRETPLQKDSEERRKSIAELQGPLSAFCKKFDIDTTVALAGVRLRQGDFFVLDDQSDFFSPILPGPEARQAAMALCGILTQPQTGFSRKFGEYPEKFDLSLSFESACEGLCSILRINPIVPRLACFDEEALKLVESRFGFSRKAFSWFMLTLLNLPLFVLECIALREFKKMVYLKELEYELVRNDPNATPPDPDFYDAQNFNDKLYELPKENLTEAVSLSHLNELFEVLLFNNEVYTKMDYDYVTAKERRQGSLAVDEARIKEIFGTKEEYYREIAQSFYASPKDPALWNERQDLNLELSWLNSGDRKKKKNVWAEIKLLLRKISLDPDITNRKNNKYGKITLGQLVLFTTLMRIRQRMNTTYCGKLDEHQYAIFCVELELLGVLFESQSMMQNTMSRQYSRIRMYKILSLALNTFVPNLWDHAVTPSLYEPEIYYCMKSRFESEAEYKAALDYCRGFVDKICSGTNLKLLHYLSFKELEVFLLNPSDNDDADSVAKNITPYRKLQEPHPMCGDKEVFPCEPTSGDYFISALDPKIVQNRHAAMVRPRDLTSKAMEGKGIDSVLALMSRFESYFILEQEKTDLLLDMSVINWDAYAASREILEKAAYMPTESAAELYVALAGVVAKKTGPAFESALGALTNSICCKRDATGLKNIVLLAHRLIRKENMKVFANLSLELVEAIKVSEYPKGLLYLLR